jgi:hypothetical protein
MMVGNGVTDYRFDNDIALLDMTFWYGILDTETYYNITNNCLTDTIPNYCYSLFDNVNNALENINIYDAFGKCWTNPSELAPQL